MFISRIRWIGIIWVVIMVAMLVRVATAAELSSGPMAGATAQAESVQAAEEEKAKSKVIIPKAIMTEEEIKAALQTVTPGPGTSEWGNSYPVYGQAPNGNASETYLRSVGAFSKEVTDEKKLYLTFDEGYEVAYTPTILAALQKHGAPATFFVTGEFCTKTPELVKMIAEAGMIVGNHTVAHPDMGKIKTREAFYDQLMGVETMYKNITGYQMNRYYRPPSGKTSDAQFKEAQAMGYKTILWSVAYKDWDVKNQPSHAVAFDTILKRTHPGAIVLLHACSKTNAEILDELLTRWESMGYTFHSLEELQ